MVNALEFSLLLVQQFDPDVFYGFLALIIIGTAVSFLQGLKVGLATTAIVSAIFYYAEFFYPYSLAISLVATTLFAIEMITVSKIERTIDNFISGVYLYYRIVRNNRKHR